MMFENFSARAALGVSLFALVSAPLAAQAVDLPSPPKAVVGTLDQNLLDVMQNAQKLGFKGRYAKLEPVVRDVFNVPLMTQIAVGSGWAGLSVDQREKLSNAFGQFMTATYAQRFDGYSGEKFVETGERAAGTGTLVETQLIKSDGEPVSLNYVTRQQDGKWQVVDVFLTGTISEMATRRSEFSSVFQRDGYDGLLQTLQQKVAELGSNQHLS